MQHGSYVMQHGSYVRSMVVMYAACHNSLSVYEENIESRLVMEPQQYNIRFICGTVGGGDKIEEKVRRL